ncbi:hypothetical protein V6N13_125266 [Hibiscus sabdariffa]
MENPTLENPTTLVADLPKFANSGGRPPGLWPSIPIQQPSERAASPTPLAEQPFAKKSKQYSLQATDIDNSVMEVDTVVTERGVEVPVGLTENQ